MIVSGKKGTVTKTVNEMMKDWWRPIGGVSITKNGLNQDKYFYAQAMIYNGSKGNNVASNQ